MALGDYASAGYMGLGSDTRDAYWTVQDDWRDISSRALVMLLRDDLDNVLAAAAEDNNLFVRLSELSIVHRVRGVEEALQAASETAGVRDTVRRAHAPT